MEISVRMAHFFLQAGNDVWVDGARTLSTANGANLLAINAGNDLRLNAQGGNFHSEDASVNIVGRTGLTAQSKVATTVSAASGIEDATVADADADARLANNDGITRDDGLFQADSLTFNVNNGLFNQNNATGTDFDDRLGLRVNNLTVNGPGSGNIGIVVNGVVAGNTGISSIAPTIISGAFVPASTINGCVIANLASCAPPTPTPTPTPAPSPAPTPTSKPDPVIADPVQDVIEEEVKSSGNIINSNHFQTNLIEIKDNNNTSESGLIDEPATGAGNDDLWTGSAECEDVGESGCNVNEDIEEPELEPAE